jgi:hypothetical protein
MHLKVRTEADEIRLHAQKLITNGHEEPRILNRVS